MPKSLILGAVSIVGLVGAAGADTPNVVADIPPVHSLLAKVMDGVGSPDLLVQPGASPHGYSLRPSEASALSNANIVFWIGEGLEPWLEGSIEALAGNAHVIELMETGVTTELEFREGATFEAHDHDHEGHDHAEDAHDDDDHEHEAGGEDHDDHDHAEAEEHEHHHGHDPHAWLDPRNAIVWLDVISAELSELDPENAGTYKANAENAKSELSALIDEISAELEPVRGANFIVFHDAYQYFENRFDFSAAGSITIGDASAPSPARIEEIQGKVRELGVSCVFSEPQFNAGLVQTVFQGTEAKTGVLDPLGADLTPGPDLNPQLLRNLTGSLVDCLG